MLYYAMLLSIIMPLFNEEKTAGKIIEEVLALPLDLELIIVNNGSDDATGMIIRQFGDFTNVKIIDKEMNIGKGDAIIDGLKLAVGKYTVIQDGDLEYDPNDLVTMVNLAEKNQVMAVFGSRILNPSSGISYQRYLWGGKLLTKVANFLFPVGISDESTCYKMVRTDIMKQLNLECRRFEFCPELVAKLGRNHIKIWETPITYRPRKFEEGKKIRWIDGIEAIWTLLKYRFKPLSGFVVKKQQKPQSD
jgi:glycosyltransferase involved in cell wall biosynthesis